jgi:putative membrane protein
MVAGVASFWLAVKFVPGVAFTGEFKYLVIAGCVLGAINYFLKPMLRILTLPFRILTLGLFSWVINMAMVWTVDVIFPELIIPGLIPLFLTALIVWVVSFFLGLYSPSKIAKIETE